MIKEFIQFAGKNMMKKKLRTFLTLIGITLAIMTIFTLISVSLGLRDAVNEQFRILGSDKFFIQPRGQIAGPGTLAASLLTQKDIDIIQKVPGVKDLSYFVVHAVEIEFADQKRFYSVIGVPEDYASVFQELGSYKAEEGRLIDYKKSGEVMLGNHYKSRLLFKKQVRTGDSILINNLEFKVKAILEPIGNAQDDRLLYISEEDYLKLFPEQESIDQILVQIQEGEDIALIAERVDNRLQSLRNVNEKTRDYTILKPEELLGIFGNILSILTAFLVGIAAISILVGGIGIANTTYTSVLERTKEIGTMKAIGAQNKDIILIFITESALLGLLGGIIGVLIGFGISSLISNIATQELGTTLLQTSAPIYLFIGCLAFSLIVGIGSGFLPAWKASRLITVDALRYE